MGTGADAPQEDEVLKEWVYHPARKHPRKLAFVAILIPATAVVAWVFVGGADLGPVFAALSVAVLPGRTAAFLFPTRYSITRTKIRAKKLLYTQERSWEEFRRVDLFNGGAMLSTMARKSLLDNFRGFPVRFELEDRDELAPLITEHVRDTETDRSARAGD